MWAYDQGFEISDSTTKVGIPTTKDMFMGCMSVNDSSITEHLRILPHARERYKNTADLRVLHFSLTEQPCCFQLRSVPNLLLRCLLPLTAQPSFIAMLPILPHEVQRLSWKPHITEA